MPITLQKLSYAIDALAPAMSAQALRYHHDFHHAGYVKAVNRLAPAQGLGEASLQAVLARASGALANAAAQVFNHQLYWASMGPLPGRPDAALLRAIDRSFGSRAALARRFKAEGASLFGSGWVWLVVAPSGVLDIVPTPNAGLRVHEEALWPLLVCDVWEHAYYADYRGERVAYLDAFWRVVDWQGASRRFAAFRASRDRRVPRARQVRVRRRVAERVRSWHPALAGRDAAE